MVSDDDDLDCPLCMEEFDIADRNFRPCPCGYQICRFCWHHIKSNLNGRCPACRRQYSDQIAQFIPVSADEIVRLKKEKKEKERQHKDMKDSNRRHLSNVRVVQKNLVYVLGLSSKYASVENEFFKKYGKIAKLVVSKRSTQQTGSQSSSSVGIYVTYCRKEDAAKAISGINGSTCEGRSLRASYGTTKYCTYYLRHMSCPNLNCMYLHEPGEDVDSYTKDSLNIGKHPSGSGNQTYPNKRITPTCSTSTTTASGATGSSTVAAGTATTSQVPPKPIVRSSTSNDTQPEPPRKSAWAPIPKVVPPPPPPPVAPEPPAEIPEPEPKAEPVLASASSSSSVPVSTPAAATTTTPTQPAQPKPSSSASEQTKNKTVLEKASKPIPIEKKPALPAAASWGKGANNLASSHESVATPTNFGPSLSDALNASQKPKHSPAIPRKKEKKMKSKMIRLEDFEEGVRPSGKPGKKQQKETVQTESALSAQIHRQQQQQESPWKPIQMQSQSTKPCSEPSAPSAATAAAATTATPSSAQIESESSTKVVSGPSKEIDAMDTDEERHEGTDEAAEQKSRAEAEPLREESPYEESIVPESKPEEAAASARLKKEETVVEEKEDVQMAPLDSNVDDHHQSEDIERRDPSADAAIPVEDKTAAFDQFKVSPDTVDKPSFANYILGSVMLDSDDRNSEDAFDMEGGLSSLKGDLDSEYDAMRDAHDEHQYNVLDELERSEKVQEDDHGFTSPLLAMERFSALINEELVSGSPERPMEEFDRPPAQHPPSSLFQDLGLPFDGGHAHGPPPGIHGPPEWRAHNFDPFNGQDPAAARRLQHSQQMLEASGLFPGFAPRPPPMFGVSPDFHASGTPPPPPPPPQGPPPGMFGLPPAPMMHRPEFMNMPPGLNPPMVDKSGMASIEQGMRDMHMQQQQQQQQLQQNNNVHNESLRTMQDDLRALLPNVNISFGPMRDDNMPLSNKPHTPGHDEPEFLLHRRPSETQHVQPRFEFNNQSNNEHPRELERFNMSPHAEEKIFFASNGATHKPDDAYPEDEHERTQEEEEAGGNVKQEAQNFFGEFLRKAAATAPGGAPMHMPMEEAPRKASLPFQDPAIMSVRMSGEKKAPDMTESQNTLLQLLGGQQPPPQPQQHREPPPMLLNQAMRSPAEDPFGREMAPKPLMFMEHQQQQHSPQQQHQHQHQHQPPPPPMPFHHHQPPPPPPPPFMPGYMGGMPPPPPHYQHHHMQDPPPGMMPMPPQPPHPPLPIPMQIEMGFRPRNGTGPANFPPGLFPGGNGVRHDGM
ncbi:hypothetical protein BDB00DRAFT_841112 [Zychaea mexicana]|uniref:uncharacterized protein n=1 Tax=Zychaea mexicana TaxID=64656 RepID=UPI0022FF2FDF|nr:uncharacterized protein BDB00DRAFT_841112 [Zychaea mexicana]KAI9489866.1 hypothetical protein BDB00DRAFT_841112 [Zychaea mexicana]